MNPNVKWAGFAVGNHFDFRWATQAKMTLYWGVLSRFLFPMTLCYLDWILWRLAHPCDSTQALHFQFKEARSNWVSNWPCPDATVHFHTWNCLYHLVGKWAQKNEVKVYPYLRFNLESWLERNSCWDLLLQACNCSSYSYSFVSIESVRQHQLV